MPELILAPPGALIRLSHTLPSADIAQFPRARIYDSADTLVGAVDLSPVTPAGRYSGPYTTPVTAGRFTVHASVYVDAGRTTLSKRYGADQDTLVTDFAAWAADVWGIARSAGGAGTMGEAVRILLGLAKANFRIDQTVYNPQRFLQSCRIRLFPDSATAAASTDGGTGEGEFETLYLSGVANGTFPELPDTVLGLLP